MINNTLKYSVIIPVFRSSRTLPLLLERLTVEMERIGQPYEIIMVEDDGGDDSWYVLSSLARDYSCLKVIQLTRNFGQHNAIMCGFAYSVGEFVITMDDDLQNPPEEIERLIATAEDGADVVYGVPRQKKHHFARNVGSFLVRALYKKVFGLTVNPTAFRILRRHIVEGVCRYEKNFTFIDGLIAWHTTNIGEVEVRHESRVIGSSGYSFRKLFALAMNLLTNFSIIPLQVVSILGVIFSIVGFVLTIGYLIKYFLYGIPVPGYTSLMIGITLFSGVQMLSLGLIGEYLGRVHLNINSKPQYFVRKIVGVDS